jgi:hypothetical protein
MAHGQWTEVEARGVLTALQKSGKSVIEFARERSIVPQRIYWWQRRLEQRDAEDGVELLPVHLTESKRGEPVTVLLRSGQMVKVGRGFDEEAFARVVALLEAP